MGNLFQVLGGGARKFWLCPTHANKIAPKLILESSDLDLLADLLTLKRGPMCLRLVSEECGVPLGTLARFERKRGIPSEQTVAKVRAWVEGG